MDRVENSRGGQRLYVVRHGERVDFTFGSNWMERAFDKYGNYIRFDLNMPKSVPHRKNGIKDFIDDSPLSVQGMFQARILGEAMAENHLVFSHVYSSPALRCLQTAQGILSGLGLTKAVAVEPGIFEWMAWHQNGLPSFLTSAELSESGFVIDTSHRPIWNSLDVSETISDYYDRCHKVTSDIIEKHHNDGGHILLVCHKGSVDVCTRQLVRRPKLTLSAFRERVSKVPYCAVACCQQGADGKWSLVSPGFPCFTYSANKTYDWRLWL